MSLTDPLSDMLTRIRNGQKAKKLNIVSPASSLRANVLEVLKQEGYIRGYTRQEDSRGMKELLIELKYFDHQPVIRSLDRISKPGRRVYAKIKELKPVYNGLGIVVLSTPKGVLSDSKARELNVGGEVLCNVY